MSPRNTILVGDALKRLRQLPAYSDIPVIVFSSREFSGDELEGITLAPSHAFVKSRDREQDRRRPQAEQSLDRRLQGVLLH